LWNKFNILNTGKLTPKEFDDIFSEIYTDKLYFEKIAIEVSRKTFLMSYNEFMIKNAHTCFFQNLLNFGIDFYSQEPNLQAISLLKQSLPNFGFKKYNNGH